MKSKFVVGIRVSVTACREHSSEYLALFNSASSKQHLPALSVARPFISTSFTARHLFLGNEDGHHEIEGFQACQ